MGMGNRISCREECSMLKITGLKMPLAHNRQDLLQRAAKELRIPVSDIGSFRILKKSIDARKGEVKYIYTVEVEVSDTSSLLAKKYIVNNKNVMLSKEKIYCFPQQGRTPLYRHPVVAGAGPAGLFCAYLLAKQGYRPILLERGEAVDERERRVSEFWKGGALDPESNVQFGEGGAGTFSDGKLNTLVNDKNGRNVFVLQTLHQFGAQEEILYDSKPHIGTDILKTVVKNMRNEIIALGGTVHFQSKLTNLSWNEEHQLTEIEINNSQSMECSVLVLALGHSARDTFEMLYQKQIQMEQKSFAVGVRIEHLQEMINRNQYGEAHYRELPAAPYKLARTVETGRNVYSFCMCPGGYVVNASSEKARTAINGMSYSGRDSANANSAIIVNVTPQDFQSAHPLAGIEFQRNLEALAYRQGNGSIPVQLFGDFKENRISSQFGTIFPCIKGSYTFANLREILPDFISDSLILGIDQFSGMIADYNRYDAVLSGVESRTSSPLRMLRDEEYQSNIRGVYPCGEGAGYAGGITSAAMDGMKVAEAIIGTYQACISI